MAQIQNKQTEIADWLYSGWSLLSSQFTYSVPGAASVWPGYGFAEEPYKIGYSAPGKELAEAFVRALAAWDELIASDFIYVEDNASVRGEIRLAITHFEGEDFAAYAYFPTYVTGKPGDVWLNVDGIAAQWGEGSFGFFTVLHELGHSLGLEHSFDGKEGEEGAAVPEWLDSTRFTVMSYNLIEERYVTFGLTNDVIYADLYRPAPRTPMVLDIAAVQSIYGEDLETRKGDTTYNFEAMSSSLCTIYDADGQDTLDLSAIAFVNLIDLRPGAYSSVGMASVDEQIVYWSEKYPASAQFITQVFNEELSKAGLKAYTFVDNVAIALSTVIENVLGGSGRDEILGNSVANLLVGNLGDDVLIGLAGSDRLEGGGGNDQLYGDDISVAAPVPVPQPEDPAPPVPLLDTPVSGGGLGIEVVPAVAPVSGDLPTSPGVIKLSGSTSGLRLAGADDGHEHSYQIAVREYLFAPQPTDFWASLLQIEGLPVPSEPEAEPESEPETSPEPSPDSFPVAPTPPPVPANQFDDSLFGGEGDDVLIGGPGRDFLSGGAGADQFRFSPGDILGGTVALADVVSDFSQAEGDVIDLGAIDAIAGGSDDAFRFIGTAAFSGTGGELRTVQHDGYLLLEGDIIPDGIADFAIRFDGLTCLSVSAIIV